MSGKEYKLRKFSYSSISLLTFSRFQTDINRSSLLLTDFYK